MADGKVMSEEGRRLLLTKAGAPNTIEIGTYSPESPAAGEVRIRTAFAGINFADLMMRLGLYQPRPPYPFTPGYELSGHIDALGEGVTGFELGQAVVAGVTGGAQQTHVCAPASQTFALPEGVSLEQAAAMPVTHMTAWHMLVHLANLQPGQSVLIHGAAGGVGTAALQICRIKGAGLVLGTCSGHKSDVVEANGGVAIDRYNDDFVSVVKQHTDGRGVDVILDPVGGKNLRNSLRCLASGGHLFVYGFSAAAPGKRRAFLRALWAWKQTPRFDPFRLMMSNKSVHGVHMGTLDDQELMRSYLALIIGHMQMGAIDPVIDRSFPLAEAAAAHEFLHDHKNIGKVLLDMS
jgi:NADPH:quinone reductase-like Zn-dependent oxidoreductase